MGTMKTAEITFLAILAAFAASLAIGSLDLKYADEFSFGPGFVPLNVGVLIVICCALQALRSLAKSRKEAAEAGDRQEHADTSPNIAGLLITTAIIVLGVAAMALGSVLAPIFAMIFLLSWRVAHHPITSSLFVGATTTAAIYVIFAIWLNLPVL
ncbi:Tripartite tricarboxylate transporter TctB family protein [Cohaesibacter marisflavi]|uniref:Tripartite tricarboxylate transporter TctB family protein n=2 Tax=Cohaesibacter marisflavi TaxID=655353 RepID=A0A1I4ZCA7_9HYPH|nr:Tripartite tricarboxylate transporter TctB family protein [Cohaesibacter marisflavi]